MQKSVLITGAATRIGRALALGLSDDGWAIAVHYNRSRDAANILCKEITDNGGKAASVQANLNIPQQRDNLIEAAHKALDTPITALINNASTFTPDEAQNFDTASYEHHFNANLLAPLKLSQDFAAQLPKGHKGVIINMLDQRVLHTSPSYFTYSLSKSALFAATKSLAQSLAPHIRVCAIGPGPSLKNKHQSENEFEREVNTTLLKTGSPPSALLDAVRYLLHAETVTGQMIAVDGGEHLNWERGS
jgi:NAD(P)-dependent dehydrogenase (short-subunit alcohol dehydrogenase family)